NPLGALEVALGEVRGAHEVSACGSGLLQSAGEFVVGDGDGVELAVHRPHARRELEELLGLGADLELAQAQREAIDPLFAGDVEFHGYPCTSVEGSHSPPTSSSCGPNRALYAIFSLPRIQ